MRGRIFGLDPTRALIAAKSCAAIVVGYGLGLSFDWKASSIAVTIIVLQTATLGTTLTKATLRMVGTLSGALAGLAIVASGAHDREIFIVCMALVTAICVWKMQASTHQYAWMLVMLTCAIVGWPTAMNPLNAFHTAVDRVTAVTVGVLLSSLAHGLFWPLTSGRQFEQMMRDLVAGCRDMALLVRLVMSEQDLDVPAVDEKIVRITSLSSSLAATLQAARADSKRFQAHFVEYEQVCNTLEELVSATAAIGGAATLYRHELTAAAVARSTTLQRSLDALEEACVATVRQLSLPRDGTCRPNDPTAAADANPTSREESALHETAAVHLLAERIGIFQDRAARVRGALSEAESATVGVLAETAAAKAVPRYRTRFAKSALAALQVEVGAWFFVLLDWPLGIQSAMILVMIFAFLNAQLPVALPARTIFKSTLSALPLAAVFHFVLMPRLDSFLDLSPWLALLFFPLLYGITSRNPLTSMSAMLIAILANALISISSTPPNYDFASFANTYLGVSGGIAAALLLAYLFETRSPRRAFHGVLTALLAESADFVKTVDPGFPSPPEGASLAKQHRRHYIQSLGRLKKLAASVDYRKDPYTDHQHVGAVLRAVDVLAARLVWSAVLRTLPDRKADTGMRSVNRAHEWCAETLAATGKALAAFQPVAVQPPSDTWFRDLDLVTDTGESSGDSERSVDRGNGAAVLLTYYRALADAIVACQNELNQVEWKRWSQNYF